MIVIPVRRFQHLWEQKDLQQQQDTNCLPVNIFLLIVTYIKKWIKCCLVCEQLTILFKEFILKTSVYLTELFVTDLEHDAMQLCAKTITITS